MVSRGSRPASGRKPKRGRTKSRRLGLYSMLATVALLGGVIWLGSYYSLQPRVEALPSTIPFSREEWMDFVPDSAQFVAYVNYQAAYEATGNYTLFGTNPLIEIYSPPVGIYPNSVEYEVAINLAGQGGDQGLPSVSVLKLELNEAHSLDSALGSSSSLHRTPHGKHEIYALLIRRKELQTQLVSASVAVRGQHLLFAQGPGSGVWIGQLLDTADYGQNHLFSQSSAQTALYASGGSQNEYLALFVTTFPTQVEGAKIAVKTVSTMSGVVSSRFAFSFDSQDQARAHYEKIRGLYTGGSDYWILGSYVVVTFRSEMAGLSDQIRGL